MLARRVSIGCLLLFLPACSGGSKLPSDVVAVLENADTFELLSLDPEHESTGNGRQQWPELGKTAIQSPETRQRVLAALNQGVAEGGTAAKCFFPRHGIRAVRGDTTVDLVMRARACFECHQIYVYFDGKRSASAVLTSGSPEATLDEVLKTAGVPLAKKRSEK